MRDAAKGKRVRKPAESARRGRAVAGGVWVDDETMRQLRAAEAEPKTMDVPSEVVIAWLKSRPASR